MRRIVSIRTRDLTIALKEKDKAEKEAREAQAVRDKQQEASRKGTTYKPSESERSLILLSIPAVLGANILTLKDAIQENSIIVSDIPVYLVGVAVAAVVGYICIRLLKMIADKGKFGWFAYYCWAVGLIVLALTLVLK